MKRVRALVTLRCQTDVKRTGPDMAISLASGRIGFPQAGRVLRSLDWISRLWTAVGNS